MGILVGGMAAACSPACNPPDAKNPGTDEPRGAKASQASSERGEKAAKLAEHEKKRAELPKGDMIMEAPGVDIKALSEAQRGVFFQVINTEPSACDKPHSMARSLKDDPDCRDSQTVAQFVADNLAAGAAASAVKGAVPQVVSALQPREINIEGRPVYGSERAPVTVVVFADFECPHCRKEAPVLRKAIDSFRGRAKLVYKHFPLGGHKWAKIAAIATEAAFEQGKFWEMHDLLYENNRALSDADLARYAKKAGCSVSSFKSALSDRTITRAIDDDVALATRLGARGTPSFFVNGRYLAGAQPFSAFKALIDEELAHAERAIAGGTSASALYEELMRTAKTSR